jgi:hypothetical protein
MKNPLSFLALNKSPKPEHCAFLEAFLPQPDCPPVPANITMAWVEQSSVAIDALIAFRSAVHCWQAKGQVPDAEFAQEAERLRLAGLADWLDDLMAVADAVMLIEELRFGGE